MKQEGTSAAAGDGLSRSVSVVASDHGALLEVAQLLAREGIGVSQGRIVATADGSDVLDAFQAVQGDRAAEIVILAVDEPSSDATEQLLKRVREGAKPTVVCFLGSDPRLAWRAGAIPATRLDEAALRAVAWVRDWDQALISSQLEEERDELAALVGDLRPRIGPGRVLVRGLFASDTLRHEAQLQLAKVLGEGALSDGLAALSADMDVGMHLRAAWADSACGAMLLSLALGIRTANDSIREVITTLRALRGGGPVPIAHLCGDSSVTGHLAEAEAGLKEAGAVIVPSSASAALLAGLLVQRVAKGG